MIKNFAGIFRKRSLANIQSRMGSVTESKGPVAETIFRVITEHLKPVHLEVINESYMHNVPKESETHFKILVVSTKFEELPLIKRHRLVNQVVKEGLGELFPHALSIEAKTVKQWKPSYVVEPSPNCRGGFGK